MKINACLIKKNFNKRNDTAINEIMMKIGLIEKISAGIYIWLPIGIKIINKIKFIIEKNLIKNNFIETNLPLIQPEWLWKISYRFNEIKKIIFSTINIENKNFILAPTNEECITFLMQKLNFTHNIYPIKIFQIQKLIRNEKRSRSGIVRSKEFFMKEAYSFHNNIKCWNQTYKTIFKIYKNIFNLLKIKFLIIKNKNDNYEKNISHEFHVLSKFGEQKIKKRIIKINNKKIKIKNLNIKYKNIIFIKIKTQTLYFNTKKKLKYNSILNIPFFFKFNKKLKKNSMEIAHIFKIGDIFSKNFNLYINKNNTYINMNCYGIGLNRLLVSIIENNFKNNVMYWPKLINPFKLAILSNKNTIYAQFFYIYFIKKFDILHDDRKLNTSEKINHLLSLGIHKFLILNKNMNKIKFINTLNNINMFIKFNILKYFLKYL